MKNSMEGEGEGEGVDAGRWRGLGFWRDVLWYFLVFAYVGHFIEMGWAWFCHLVLGEDLKTNILALPYEPYTIYGTGAVLMILLVRPVVRKIKDNLLVTFLVATVVCAILEYVTSVVLVWQYGRNPFWWYEDRAFNMGGHICLENSILFGLLATVFLKLIYPLTEKLLRRGKQVVINVVLVGLMVAFVAYYVALALF